MLLAGCIPGAEPEEIPVPGGTLRVAVRDLGSLDPARATGRGALLAVSQLFLPLTRIDPISHEVLPASAESWDVSDDGLTWTFRIARGFFHDGTRVRAGDFKFAFDRLARRDLEAEAAFQLEPVRGFRAARIEGTEETLAGVQVVDGETLRIRLEEPFAELEVALAHPALAPLPRDRYLGDGSDLEAAPVGNGPYRLAAPAQLEQGVRLERFDGWEGETAYLDAVELQVVADVSEGWRAFREGDVHFSEVPAGEVNPGGSGGGFTPFWAAVYYGPNLDRAKYRPRGVREALSLAVDRTALARTVYGDTKDEATGVVPRGVRGFAPDACAMCRLDRERARALLAEAFPDEPLSLVIDHIAASPSREVARAVAADLEAVGVEVRLRSHNPGDYVALLQERRHDLAELGWLAEVPSPDGFLAQQLRTGSPNNPMGFSDETFDQLIEAARVERNEGRRIALYREAEARALEQMPIIPLVFFRNRFATSDEVRNLIVDGAGLFDAAAVWLAGAPPDPAARAPR